MSSYGSNPQHSHQYSKQGPRREPRYPVEEEPPRWGIYPARGPNPHDGVWKLISERRQATSAPVVVIERQVTAPPAEPEAPVDMKKEEQDWPKWCASDADWKQHIDSLPEQWRAMLSSSSRPVNFCSAFTKPKAAVVPANGKFLAPAAITQLGDLNTVCNDPEKLAKAFPDIHSNKDFILCLHANAAKAAGATSAAPGS